MLSIKDQINQAAPEQGGTPAHKLSVNDFLIKAWALALIRVPEANISWTANTLQQYFHVDVGVAVAIPGGLITPIVREAEIKSISAVSNEMKNLAGRARSRKLKPEEYEGGTTSISNLGMLGIKHFSAVLNPPQATLLAVGAAEKRIVVKDDAPAVGADILYYHGQDSNITALYAEHLPDIPQGYAFDFASAHALTTLSVRDRDLVTANGMRYRFLALDPRARVMSLDVLSSCLGRREGPRPQGTIDCYLAGLGWAQLDPECGYVRRNYINQGGTDDR